MNMDLITIGLMGIIWLWIIRDTVIDAIKTYYREKLRYTKELCHIRKQVDTQNE